MVQNLLQMGFFQFAFPFLLALAIMYGVLSWALEKQLPKSARGLVSIVFAFFVMLYSSMNPEMFMFITGISGPWLMIASLLIFVVILFGLVGLDLKSLGKKAGEEGAWNWKMGILALIIVVILLGFFASYSNINIPGVNLMDSSIWSILFFVIILAVVMHFLTKDGNSSGGNS